MALQKCGEGWRGNDFQRYRLRRLQQQKKEFEGKTKSDGETGKICMARMILGRSVQ
jgi:hypothetical protein